METNGALPKRYLNIDELAIYLAVPKSTIYAWVQDRSVPFTPVANRTYRFDIKAIDKWMEKKLVWAKPSGYQTQDQIGGK